MQCKVALTILCSLSGAAAVEPKPILGGGSVETDKPKGSLRASSWTTKIPAISKNLELASEWMTVITSVDQNYMINGTVNMVVGVKDARHYHKCGLAMNTAWGSMAHNPCSDRSWAAADNMADMAAECSKLRYGDKYEDSYRALKEDQDTWCGGPHCTPDCAANIKCVRGKSFPFEPHCESYPEAAVEADVVGPPTISSDRSVLWLLLSMCVVIVCLMGAVAACNFKAGRLSTMTRSHN